MNTQTATQNPTQLIRAIIDGRVCMTELNAIKSVLETLYLDLTLPRLNGAGEPHRNQRRRKRQEQAEKVFHALQAIDNRISMAMSWSGNSPSSGMWPIKVVIHNA